MTALKLMPSEKLAKNDKLYANKTPSTIEARHDPEFERQMKAAEKIMLEDRDVLKKLAQ